MYIDYVQQLLIINAKNQTDTMHLDIHVAYDTVTHNELLVKLKLWIFLETSGSGLSPIFITSSTLCQIHNS